MRLSSTLLASGAILAACLSTACGGSRSRKAPAAAAPAAAGATIQGTVKEVLAAPPYSYLRLQTAQGEIWAAVPAAQLAVGAPVTLQAQIQMANFPSQALNRTFPVLYMGTLAGAAAPATPAGMPSMAGMAGMAPHGAPQPETMEKVAKAPGADGYTIAELYAGSGRLKDRSVTVRGKVVKYMEGILGKTWIHLRDGSGEPGKGDFDLTVTTKDVAKVGDVVTVKGVLRLKRDVGSGYVYPVIVEDARLTH